MIDVAGSFQSQDIDLDGYNTQGVNCTWRIEVPATYREIELYVIYFYVDFQSSAGCSSGRVEVS